MSCLAHLVLGGTVV